MAMILPKRRLLLVMMGLCLLAGSYSGWSRYRFSDAIMVHGEDYPQPFPYPDEMLMATHDFLDRVHPPPPGILAPDGHVPELRRALEVITSVFVFIALCALYELSIGFRVHAPSDVEHRKRGPRSRARSARIR